MRLFEDTHIDFVKWRWHAIALSLVVIIAGGFAIARGMLPLGVDFSGGTIVVVKFDQHVPIDRVRGAVSAMPDGVGNDAVVQEFGEELLDIGRLDPGCAELGPDLFRTPVWRQHPL